MPLSGMNFGPSLHSLHCLIDIEVTPISLLLAMPKLRYQFAQSWKNEGQASSLLAQSTKLAWSVIEYPSHRIKF